MRPTIMLPAMAATATMAVVATTSIAGATPAAGLGPAAVVTTPQPWSDGVTEPSRDRCAQPGPYELPSGSEPVRLDPGKFTTRIDHPYWPMRPGTTWRYVERGGGEVARVRITVTDRTTLIEGVRARVVHDVVRVEGQITENTWDWYAQDAGGSLWYLGERTREYEDGRPVSSAGSWRYGRGGAQAGVILPARLRAGCGYREEYLAGEAQDEARILSTREVIRTPSGLHHAVVQTANTTPVDPDLLENKFYARGIGPVLELDLSPQLGRAVLVSHTQRR